MDDVISVQDLSNIEELLSASKQSRAVKAVASLQGSSVKQKTDKITMDELNAEIKVVRKKLRK